jgi:hypothetical protein
MTHQSTGIDENDEIDLKGTAINHQQRHNNQPAAMMTQQSTSSDVNDTTINWH